jgi:membrane dipeptidase
MSSPPKLANVKDLVDHIDHVVQLVGVDYVGIGSDFDGGGAIDGCADASEMINITVELLRRGYKEKEIRKIWGENFLRVFREVEEFAINSNL